MRYQSAADFRTALEARLATQAREEGIDLQRLRKRVVFERMLVRLEKAQPGRWVLKGGVALEVRLRERARATRDLDLALREDARDGDGVRDGLIEALIADPDGDGFTFEVSPAQALRADTAGRPGWRFSVRCSLAGRVFDQVRVDVVARLDETDRTERLPLPGSLSFAQIPTGDVEVVSPAQHFAEKLHALTRTYGDRPSSRTRDLVDLAILIEERLVTTEAISPAVEGVFGSRGTHPVPVEIPDPPAGWKEDYAGMAEELDIDAKTIDDAMHLVRQFWSKALASTPRR
ncbi:MAG: nucleotidyl transferase AbiEii/AbiGii toxin family protein [Actinomycetota bacterium]